MTSKVNTDLIKANLQQQLANRYHDYLRSRLGQNHPLTKVESLRSVRQTVAGKKLEARSTLKELELIELQATVDRKEQAVLSRLQKTGLLDVVTDTQEDIQELTENVLLAEQQLRTESPMTSSDC